MTEMTGEEQQSVRDELKAFMARTNTSQGAVAKAIDYSAGVIGPWLRGTYTGRGDDITRAVAGFLERHVEREQCTAPEDWPFALTAPAKEVLGVLHYAHAHGTLGVIVGRSGNGKSRAIKEYVARTAGVLLLTIYPSTKSLAEVVYALNELVGERARGSLGGLTKRVIKALAGSRRLLIVDEAQGLDHPAVELLRAVRDQTGIGVVVAGMPRLDRAMTGNHVEIWEQIRTRVGLKKHTSPLTVADVALIVRAFDPGASDAVCARTHAVSAGIGRSATTLYQHAHRAARAAGRPVTPDDVLAAQAFLYPAPDRAHARPAPAPPAPAALPRAAAARATA